MRVGVHWHMTGDVVENIGFRQVVQLVGAANGDGGGKRAVAQAVKEEECRYVPADRLGLKAGQGAKEAIHVRELRYALGVQAE